MFPSRLSTRIKLVFALTLALQYSTALGSGATSEEESVSDRFNGRFPMAISGDGKWLLRVDAKQVLHRTATNDAKVDQTLQLPMPVRALATTQSGEKVAFQGELSPGCAGLVTFSESGAASRISWQNTAPDLAPTLAPPDSPAAPEPCGVAWSNVGGDTHGDKIYDPYVLALSSDGKMLAASAPSTMQHVAVIDLESGKVAFNIPASAEPLELRFIDHDHKLFVAQAVLGEVWEGEATPSDVQLMVWDLQKKELFSFYRTANESRLRHIDLLWSFSGESGDLIGFRSGAKYAPANAAPALVTQADWPGQAIIANLKHCSSVREFPSLSVFESGLRDIVADPAGRWLAYVKQTVDEKTKQDHLSLVLIDQGSGKELAQWPLEENFGALTVSRDGLVIYANSFGTVSAGLLDYADDPWSFWGLRGGGQLRRFDLSAFVEQKAAGQPVSWPAKACAVEDELPLARDVSVANKPHALKFVVPLSDMKGHFTYEANDKSPCGTNNYKASSNYLYALKTWGRADNDSIWVDRWDKLEQINPANGAVMRAIATPRSKAVCSMPLYDRRQFLNWQGDTISLRPFAEGMKLGERKVLVSKPGWSIEAIEMLGEHIGVRWVENRFRNQNTRQMGAVLAVLYDLNGKKLEETAGFVDAGMGAFEGDGEDVDLFYGKELIRDRGDYHWSKSYVNSIRAQDTRATIKPGKAGGTALWAGLKIDAAPLAPEFKLADVGASLAAKIEPGQVLLFDAAKRQQVAQIKVYADGAEWDKSDHLLLLEVRNNGPQKSAILQAYRIDD